MTDDNALNYFKNIEDPRANNKRHQLSDIIAIAVLSVLCGAETWEEMEEYGQAKEEWLQEFLELNHGIPSNDTYRRLFMMIDPDQFRDCFLQWIESLSKTIGSDIIAVDGKTLRRSFNGDNKNSAIHMVSAWSSNHQMVLGQMKTEEKSNEITAIPKLLKLLDISGSIVTIDAMGTQKSIAGQIIDQEGDYVLSLKGNQETIHEEVKLYFADEKRGDFTESPVDYHETFDGGEHGRFETRKYWITSNISWMEDRDLWKGLNTIGMVESEREENGKTTKEVRYFLSSIPEDAKLFASAVRSHWGIENALHWCLDMGFREDECRIRSKNAPENLAIIRHLCLNLLKNEKTCKAGIKIKRNKAGWDNHYLLKVLEANAK